MVRKSAFTLIELIFAIVIIAITVISLPMMNQVVSKGIDSNIVQEAIFASATELNEVVTGHWDENSIEPNSPNSYARVIDIGGFCDNNTSSPRYRLMPGHINQPLHRRCLNSSATTPANASATAVESLEDSEHVYLPIFLGSAPSASGYKEEYKSKIEVDHNITFAGSNNPNIKRITVTITNSNDNIISSLRTYSANIGEVDYYKRTY
ncbi:prepilin-type N-terminal cleavage/methylation domain-containing protein [Sulfurimonas sp.]|uniref:prepilin-type N-terminal cleavage/methylation domain-containing protein n=1 Tax=Sulfurimonas sp. TaxID=2022749 RepID=UPI002603A381|nr:prepilin-type N-terminal cleavage/methylation domain-containing protein [Sulfurimonas sp.]